MRRSSPGHYDLPVSAAARLPPCSVEQNTRRACTDVSSRIIETAVWQLRYGVSQFIAVPNAEVRAGRSSKTRATLGREDRREHPALLSHGPQQGRDGSARRIHGELQKICRSATALAGAVRFRQARRSRRVAQQDHLPHRRQHESRARKADPPAATVEQCHRETGHRRGRQAAIHVDLRHRGRRSRCAVRRHRHLAQHYRAAGPGTLGRRESRRGRPDGADTGDRLQRVGTPGQCTGQHG